MWPKVFAQLVDVLPHVTRLIPMADLFFTSKTAGEKASEAALTTLSTDVRNDLGKVSAAHDGLYRQLQGLSAEIATVASDASRARFAIETYANRADALERQLAELRLWVKSVAVLLGLVLAGVAALLVRGR